MLRFILLVVLCASNAALASDEKFVMKVDEDLKVMKYDRGLLYSSWKPYAVDGWYFIDTETTMSFEDYAQKYYITKNSPNYRFEYFQTTRNVPDKCRIYPRRVGNKVKGFSFYLGIGNTRKYAVFDDLEDYLVFSCEKE
jgi:Tfp pilus assembly protein PilZ